MTAGDGSGRRLQRVTGWSLLAAAAGIFVDAWASWTLDRTSPDWLLTFVTPNGPGDGSIGLIPAYLGGTIGLVGLVVVLHREVDRRVAALAGIAVLATFVFWYSYPDHATSGGLGSILLGIAVLALPTWGRLASPLWIAAGVMGIPELVQPGIHWGPVASFTLVGAALGATGAFVLWGERDASAAPDAATAQARRAT